MKKIFISASILLLTQTAVGQQNYCDFEGNKTISFAFWNGSLDSMRANPASNLINGSANCARHIRDTATYDNIVILPYSKLMDVSPYTSTVIGTPKIKVKVYSTAPVGTQINIELGIRSNTTYPAGIHSVFSASTSTQRTWELLTLNYLQSPVGSSATATNIDKILFLFNPGSHAKDTVYFDDITGPNETALGIEENESLSSFKLFQNKPNPAKDNTNIKFFLNSGGFVSMKLYDVLGKQIFNLLDQNMSPGMHSIPVEIENIPDGIYFYVLKKDGVTQTKKMIISK